MKRTACDVLFTLRLEIYVAVNEVNDIGLIDHLIDKGLWDFTRHSESLEYSRVYIEATGSAWHVNS